MQIAAVVIFKHQDKILIAERKGGKFDHLWEFPGGKLEVGETPLDAIKREVFEELNLKLDNFIYKDYIITQTNTYIVKLYIFVCEIPLLPITSNVHYQVKWIEESQLIQYQRFPNMIDIYNLSKKIKNC